MGPKELCIKTETVSLHIARVYTKRFNCVVFVVSL